MPMTSAWYPLTSEHSLRAVFVIAALESGTDDLLAAEPTFLVFQDVG